MKRANFVCVKRLVSVVSVATPVAVFAFVAVWIVPLPVLLSVLGGMILLTSKVALAQPRTRYKARDIENARQNLERYGWAQEIVDGWKENVAFALQQDRSFFEAFIPELTPGTHYGQNCPHCVGKQSLMGVGHFDWDISDPDRIVCHTCGTVYPNEAYPETGVLECPRMGQRFTYYETPEERDDPENRAKHALKWLGDRPTMTSLSGDIRYRKASWAWNQASALAKLYAVTEEIGCAERAVWILDRFARVFPNYLYHSYDGSVADWPPAEVAANMGKEESAGGPRGGRFPGDAICHAYGLHQGEDYATLNNGFWGAGRMNVHGKGSDAGPLFYLTVAYDLIQDAQDADGRRLMDADTNRPVLEDLILSGCADMEHWDSLSNKGTAVFVLSGAVGMLLEQPERVRRAIAGYDRMLEERYHHDGFYSESPGYSAHNFSNVHELPDLLCGYSDPPGYVSEDGSRLDDLDPFATGRLSLSLLSLIRMLAPGNRMPVIGDTRYETKADLLSVEVLAARLGGSFAGLLEVIQEARLSEKGSEYALWYRPADLQAEGEALPLYSEWFPGWHVGVLRGGQEADTALYLNGNEHQWTVQTGHRQQDILSLSYYAFGEELASDRGYFSGSSQRLPDGRNGQSWAKSSLSHNLVVVDEEEQTTHECGSNLELFGVAPGIEVVQASGVNVYPQCEAYGRTCAMVETPKGQTYIVDFFRVKGGRIHQYCFHCNGSPVEVEPATQSVEMGEAWRTWVDNTRAFSPETPGTFTWTFRDVNLDLMLLQVPDRIVLADAPGWRLVIPEELEKPPVRQILAENRAGDSDEALDSRYAALMVPYQKNGSPVVAARLLEDDPDSGALAVEVKFDGRTDYIISTLDQQERQFGPVRVAGEFAFVSVDDQGRTLQGYLLNGTALTCGDFQITLPEANTTLKVQSVDDRTYHLAEPLPDPQAAIGSYVLVGESPQTGFEIASATQREITVRDYPAVVCDEVTILNAGWVRLDS